MTINKKFRTILIFVLIALCIFQLFGCQVRNLIQADYPFYDNEKELFNHADNIIFGEIVKVYNPEKIDINMDKTKQANEEDKVLYTVSDVKVLDVIKGIVKVGDIVKVKQLGDEHGNADSELFKHGGYFKKGSQYILFLKGYTDSEIPYSTLNPIQGQIEMIEDKTKVNELNKLFQNNKTKDEFINELIEKMTSNIS